MKKPCEIIVCVGAGGVGKTTVSSVIALQKARLGHKTLVITLDPAKRLADALGLKEVGDRPHKVDCEKILGDKNCQGELFAYMPDLKFEWMDFLSQAVENSNLRKDISKNPFYQYMVDGLPGALEIICSHILFRLRSENKFDVIILDTPPSSHSVAFFDVPKKIANVLNQKIFRAIMGSRKSVFLKFTKKLAFFSSGIIEKTLEKIIGSHFLSELIEFALTIDDLYAPMLRRSEAMSQMLTDRQTHFVLVGRPTRASVNDCKKLKSILQRRQIEIDEVVLNQAMPKSETLLAKKSGSSSLLELYQKQIHLEETLSKELRKTFNKGFKPLFLGQNVDTTSLLKELVHNYSQ